MTQFSTPPWRISEDDLGYLSIRTGERNSAPDADLVASVYDEANARLIAAAPELYEALELYQRAIGPLTGKPLTDEQWKRLHDIYAIAATALNEGGER